MKLLLDVNVSPEKRAIKFSNVAATGNESSNAKTKEGEKHDVTMLNSFYLCFYVCVYYTMS